MITAESTFYVLFNGVHRCHPCNISLGGVSYLPHHCQAGEAKQGGHPKAAYSPHQTSSSKPELAPPLHTSDRRRNPKAAGGCIHQPAGKQRTPPCTPSCPAFLRQSHKITPN